MDEQNFAEEEVDDGVDILDFTPYLFPLSSMTDEQQINLTKFVANGINGENILYVFSYMFKYIFKQKLYLYNKH